MMKSGSIMCAMLVVAATHGAFAATVVADMSPSSGDDVPAVSHDGSAAMPSLPLVPDPPRITVVRPPAVHTPPPAHAMSANPLWMIPLSALSSTRERPIFSPSRRPVPAAVAPAAVAVAAKPREPVRPQLSLVGTIEGTEDGFGIFLDQSSRAALRLKTGDQYQGWTLRSVRGREATLEKDQHAVTLALPQPTSPNR